MSRISYAEDEDFQNQAMLWEANLERSLNGKKGQAALRELEAALLALPEKRLIAEELENAQGEVCAIGALGRFKGKQIPKIVVQDLNDALDDDEILPDEIEQETLRFAQEDLGVPRLVALAIVSENDGGYWSKDLTPEQRYRRVLDWTQRRLRKQL